jgi:hypothetical protein
VGRRGGEKMTERKVREMIHLLENYNNLAERLDFSGIDKEVGGIDIGLIAKTSYGIGLVSKAIELAYIYIPYASKQRMTYRTMVRRFIRKYKVEIERLLVDGVVGNDIAFTLEWLESNRKPKKVVSRKVRAKADGQEKVKADEQADGQEKAKADGKVKAKADGQADAEGQVEYVYYDFSGADIDLFDRILARESGLVEMGEEIEKDIEFDFRGIQGIGELDEDTLGGLRKLGEVIESDFGSIQEVRELGDEELEDSMQAIETSEGGVYTGLGEKQKIRKSRSNSEGVLRINSCIVWANDLIAEIKVTKSAEIDLEARNRAIAHIGCARRELTGLASRIAMEEI